MTPAPAAPQRQWRFADGVIDRSRQRWTGLREDHTGDREPINTIVAVDLHQPGHEPGRVLVGGHVLRVTPIVAGWPLAHLADVGSSHHAVEWHNALAFRIGRSWERNRTLTIAGSVSESVLQPADGEERLATAERATIVIERDLDGKMRATSASWDGERAFLKDQVLEVRNVDGGCRSLAKLATTRSMTPTDRAARTTSPTSDTSHVTPTCLHDGANALENQC